MVFLNDSSPSSTVNSQFHVSIEKVSETTTDGNVAQFVLISSVNFSKVTDNTISNYSATLPNGAFLSVIISIFFLSFFVFFFLIHNHIYQFTRDTIIEFAGTNITYRNNTLKFALSVYNWPFLALSNSLLVFFKVSASSSTTLCSLKQWVIITVGDTSLYLVLSLLPKFLFLDENSFMETS